MKLPSAVRALIDRLEKAGYLAYAVGGAVRDALRGKEPSDWDLACSALPEETLAVFSDLPTVPTGLAHGTVTVISEGMPVEITTFRSDGEYGDHRHPLKVCFGCSLEEDLARRDFTVNAVAYSPCRGFVDPFGGREDLASGILRAVGDPRKRFGEDALRIMRALRFSSVLGYDIEADTADAVREKMGDLAQVSAERIWKEWLLLLGGSKALSVLGTYPSLIRFLFPELWGDGEEIWGLSRLREGEPTMLRLALLLCKPSLTPQDNLAVAQRQMKRLKCSNEQLRTVGEILKYGREFPEDETSRKLLWAQEPAGFSLWAQLHFLLCDKPFDSLSSWEKQRYGANECLTLSQLSLKGQELAALGYRGKEIAAGLQRLLYAVAAGELPNEREELCAFAAKQKASSFEKAST